MKRKRTGKVQKKIRKKGRKGGMEGGRAMEQGKEWKYNDGSVCTSTYQISSPYGTFYFHFLFI